MSSKQVSSTVPSANLRLDQSAKIECHSPHVDNDAESKGFVAPDLQRNDASDPVDELVDQLTQEISREVVQQQRQKMSELIHDLRHPLAAIRGVTDLVLMDSLSERQRERIDIIKATCESLLDLLTESLNRDNLTAESPLFDPKTKVVDVDQLMHETLREAAYASKDRQLELFYYRSKSTSRWARLDLVAIKQILGNLVSNAVKFTQAGSVSVEMNQVERDGQAHLHWMVEDTGAGIPRHMEAKIFERYSQVEGNDSRGVGLGLAICRQLVEQLDGQLWAETCLGSGSRFHVTVPCVENSLDDPDTATISPATLTGRRVLLVSPNTRQAQIFRDVLGDAGARVSFASPQDFRAIVQSDAVESLDHDSFVIAADPALEDLIPLLTTQCNIQGAVVWLADPEQSFCAESGLDHILTKPIFYDELVNAVSAGRVRTLDSIADDRGKRILIVDDCEINRMISAEVFNAEGHQVDLLADGAEVVSAIASQTYDLILLDLEMPGINGFETASALRSCEAGEGSARIPIVAITAHEIESVHERAVQHGIDLCLRKPLETAALWEALAELDLKGLKPPVARWDPCPSNHSGDETASGGRVRTSQLRPLKKLRQ